MTTTTAAILDDATAQHLAEGVADFFRTASPGTVLAEDVFLDGHPPFWRFQIQGRDEVTAWYRSYAPDGVETTVVNVVPTVTGFVAEVTGRHVEDGELVTDRKLLLCEVRDELVSALTVYCSGDWDEALRARHAAEADLLRP